jgi:hypothetical protein
MSFAGLLRCDIISNMFQLKKQWFVVGVFCLMLAAIFWPGAFALADILSDSNNFYL